MPKLEKVLRCVNFLTAVLILYSVGLLLLLRIVWVGLALVTLIYLYGQRRRTSEVLGNARWSEPPDIPHLLKDEGGLPIGMMGGRASTLEAALGLIDSTQTDAMAVQKFLSAFQRGPPGRHVYLNTAIHTLVCASSGAGKSVSLAIPFLRSCRHSVVVLDVKGELVRTTLANRKRFGQVAVIDPFGMVGGRDTYNVLDINPQSPYAIDDCNELAHALILKTDGAQDPYWNAAATQMLGAFLALFVAETTGKQKSLQVALDAMSRDDLFQRCVASMMASTAFGGMIARNGHQLAAIHSKQLSSLKAIIHENLSFLSSPAIAAVTGHVSTFDLRMLRRGVLTVYVVVPPERAEALAGYLRMLTTAFARAAIREGLEKQGRVTFLLDEAATLKNLSVLSTILQIGRAYQLHLQLFYQSLGQLIAAWPGGGEKVVLANTAHVLAGTNDYSDADLISKRLGVYSAVLESGGTGTSHSTSSSAQGGSTSYSQSGNNNWSWNSTPLLRPEQILTLPERTAITFLPNTRPIMTRLVPYWSQNTGGFSRTKCVTQSVVLLLSALVLATLSTLIVKEFIQWKRIPNPKGSSTGSPKAYKPSGKAPSGKSQRASTTAR